MGAFYCLFHSLQPDSTTQLLADQLFKAYRGLWWTFTAILSSPSLYQDDEAGTYSLSPPSGFQDALQVTLRQSSVLFSFLLDEDKVKDAMQLAVKSAFFTFNRQPPEPLSTGAGSRSPLRERNHRPSSSGSLPQRSTSSSSLRPTSPPRRWEGQRLKPKSFPDPASSKFLFPVNAWTVALPPTRKSGSASRRKSGF